MTAALSLQGRSTTEMVEAAVHGDAGAWAEMVTRYAGLVRGVADRHRLQESDAADAVQNTWLRAVERVHTLRQPERLPGWLATVAERESLAVLRRRGREVAVDDTWLDPSGGGPDPEAEAVRGETCSALGRCVDALGDRWRRLAWELFLGPERDYATVARATGIPVGSIGPTRSRLLRQLRLALEDAGFER